MLPARSRFQVGSELKSLRLVCLVAGLLLGGCASRSVGEEAGGAISPFPKKVPQSVPAHVETPETRAAGATETGEGEDEAASIYFGYASSKVDVAGREKLRALASKLDRNSESTVTLIGRTDDLGSPSYSLAVAGKRVDAVADILRSYGVARNRISRSVRGNETLAAHCATKACKKRMRRVEVKYSP
ncbi:OmpA family protein [Rhodocyclus tenuis]|uniref:OmpA family protein n=1 Tax=Rhodocyclus tenuis TaxID=1066 RepID=UPI0019054D97|nr:OmpA family protein [Rhodocyclus tenuis]